MSASVAADHAAAEADQRASLAASAIDRRTAPATVARRIARLGAELRAAQRQLDGSTRTIRRSQGGQPAIVETTAPATGRRRAELQLLVQELTDQMAYWSALHDEQLATGSAVAYGPDTVKPGDSVKIRGQWRSVVRPSAKSVTVRTGYSWNDRTPWHEVSDHRPSAS